MVLLNPLQPPPPLPLHPTSAPKLSSWVFSLARNLLASLRQPGGVVCKSPKGPAQHLFIYFFFFSSGCLLANALHTFHVSPKPGPESLQYFPALFSSNPCSSLPRIISAEKKTGNKAATTVQEAETPHLPCLGF